MPRYLDINTAVNNFLDRFESARSRREKLKQEKLSQEERAEEKELRKAEFQRQSGVDPDVLLEGQKARRILSAGGPGGVPLSNEFASRLQKQVKSGEQAAKSLQENAYFRSRTEYESGARKEKPREKANLVMPGEETDVSNVKLPGQDNEEIIITDEKGIRGKKGARYAIPKKDKESAKAQGYKVD